MTVIHTVTHERLLEGRKEKNAYWHWKMANIWQTSEILFMNDSYQTHESLKHFLYSRTQIKDRLHLSWSEKRYKIFTDDNSRQTRIQDFWLKGAQGRQVHSLYVTYFCVVTSVQMFLQCLHLYDEQNKSNTLTLWTLELPPDALLPPSMLGTRAPFSSCQRALALTTPQVEYVNNSKQKAQGFISVGSSQYSFLLINSHKNTHSVFITFRVNSITEICVVEWR